MMFQLPIQHIRICRHGSDLPFTLRHAVVQRDTLFTHAVKHLFDAVQDLDAVREYYNLVVAAYLRPYAH